MVANPAPRRRSGIPAIAGIRTEISTRPSPQRPFAPIIKLIVNPRINPRVKTIRKIKGVPITVNPRIQIPAMMINCSRASCRRKLESKPLG